MVRTRLYTEDEALALVRVVHARAYRYGWGDGAMGHAMQPPRDLLDGETVPEYVLRCAGLAPLAARATPAMAMAPELETPGVAAPPGPAWASRLDGFARLLLEPLLGHHRTGEWP
jgi:hypothetical protein